MGSVGTRRPTITNLGAKKKKNLPQDWPSAPFLEVERVKTRLEVCHEKVCSGFSE
jgi:hypothetical protein